MSIWSTFMNVISLSENTRPKKSNLKTEHGLSLLIEKDGCLNETFRIYKADID